jgi:DNA repair ATPase RecN
MARGHARPARPPVAAASREAAFAILDAFGGLEKEREAFGELVRRRAALEDEKSALIVDEKTYAQQLDLLRFQVKEISTARLAARRGEGWRKNSTAPATRRSCCN